MDALLAPGRGYYQQQHAPRDRSMRALLLLQSVCPDGLLRTWRCAADAALIASLRSLSLSACSLATASLTEPSCACSSLTLPRSAGGS